MQLTLSVELNNWIESHVRALLSQVEALSEN